MRLTDLEPAFRTITEPGRTCQEHDDIATADGLRFLCPKCFEANGGAVGTHSVVCWRPHVPPTETPGPGRWQIVGTGYGDLTLSPSVLITSGCMAHFFVRHGAIEMC